MPKYFEGYYCKDGNSVEGIKTENSRKVLQAISYAYPDGITAEEISQRINIPYDTVSASLSTLVNRGFIIRQKNERPVGRPKTYDKRIDSRAFKYYIENRNFALIEDEAHQYAPGYTKYTSNFLYAWNVLVEKHQQAEIYRLLLNLLNGVMTKITVSNDPMLGFVIPMSERHRDGETMSMLCKFCGINHEARDFIRAILLQLLDRLESTRPFIDFLQENHFILKDSYGYNRLLEQAMNQQEPKKRQQAKEWLDNLAPDAKETAELILKKKPTTSGEELMDRVNIMTDTPYPGEEYPDSYTTMNEHEALSVIADELGFGTNIGAKLSYPQRQQTSGEGEAVAGVNLAKKIVQVEQSLTNRGIKVTLNKVEFTSIYTRVFLKIENLNAPHSDLVTFGSVAMQGKKQLRYISSFNTDFPQDGFSEINFSPIPPGVEEEGVVVFQPVDFNTGSPRIAILRVESTVSPFIFEIPLTEGVQIRAKVGEDLTTRVIKVERTRTGGGVLITLHKLGFAERYTAVFLTLENKNREHSDIFFEKTECRAIQQKKQFGTKYIKKNMSNPLSCLSF
ncbi:MAG: MarR family transcriptional regulator [Thermoproteota archaeon]|nr:MarR family transcriptional regulator [Thermoproteota archaeon]